MNWHSTEPNLVLAWLWILTGFASGSLMGMRFARENWLGGYTSFKRRMYRLGHISFFMLGFTNLAFHLTAKAETNWSASLLPWASWTFIIGAISMPVCCAVMAHAPRFHALFVLPVGALLFATTLTLWMITQS